MNFEWKHLKNKRQLRKLSFITVCVVVSGAVLLSTLGFIGKREVEEMPIVIVPKYDIEVHSEVHWGDFILQSHGGNVTAYLKESDFEWIDQTWNVCDLKKGQPILHSCLEKKSSMTKRLSPGKKAYSVLGVTFPHCTIGGMVDVYIKPEKSSQTTQRILESVDVLGCNEPVTLALDDTEIEFIENEGKGNSLFFVSRARSDSKLNKRTATKLKNKGKIRTKNSVSVIELG